MIDRLKYQITYQSYNFRIKDKKKEQKVLKKAKMITRYDVRFRQAFFHLQVGHIAKAFLTLTFIFVKISKWLNSYIEDTICFLIN